MTQNRYEGRRPGSDARGRYSDDRFTDGRFERDERGFFERAGDEVASWFGDDEAERRRRMDNRMGDDSFSRQPRSAFGEDQGRYDRQPRFRDEGYRRPYTGRLGSSRGFEDDGGNDRSGRFTGQRDFTGAVSGVHDPHYSEWRSRQIDALDRDYDEYRRENQSRFESDFANWRTARQSKRELLSQVREHMQVVGSDEQPVGKVDKLRGDHILLTRDDSPDGRHHLISCGQLDRIDGDRVVLGMPADEALKSQSDDVRDRALFERDSDREPGAHILNRSFSGTY